MIPLNERLMTYQHKKRQGANKWTEGRANLILEVLGGMRIVKYFSYELPFLDRKLLLHLVETYSDFTCRHLLQSLEGVEFHQVHQFGSLGEVSLKLVSSKN